MELAKKMYRENRIGEYFRKLLTRIEEEDKIIVFGAGYGGGAFVDWLESKEKCLTDKICFFVDNNPEKWETEMRGRKIHKAEVLLEQYRDELILITCGKSDDVRKQLREYGIQESKILVPDIAVIDKNGLDFDFIWDNIDGFSTVFEMLEDDKSRQVLVNILNYKIAHEQSLIREIADPASEQYFDQDFIKFSKKDIFFNCGAYTGDTIENFIKKNNYEFEKIYCCESDQSNYQRLLNTVKRLKIENIECFSVGVWNFSGQMNFCSVGSGSGYISEQGKTIIPVDTIDSLLHGNKVTFINMDIEGSEYEALLGAYGTINKYMPSLAISVYHKQDDLLRIPFLIKSMSQKYHLFLRHYREESVQETVLYCLP